VALQETDGDLGAAVRLRIVLWRVLLESLLEAMDAKLSEGLRQQLHNGRFVIALEG